MSEIRPSTDVLPVTAFRANTCAVLNQIRASKRPLVLTQHGRAAAVLMDVEVYENLLDEVSSPHDANVPEEQAPRADAISDDEAVAELWARLIRQR